MEIEKDHKTKFTYYILRSLTYDSSVLWIALVWQINGKIIGSFINVARITDYPFGENHYGSLLHTLLLNAIPNASLSWLWSEK